MDNATDSGEAPASNAGSSAAGVAESGAPGGTVSANSGSAGVSSMGGSFQAGGSTAVGGSTDAGGSNSTGGDMSPEGAGNGSAGTGGLPAAGTIPIGYPAPTAENFAKCKPAQPTGGFCPGGGVGPSCIECLFGGDAFNATSTATAQATMEAGNYLVTVHLGAPAPERRSSVRNRGQRRERRLHVPNRAIERSNGGQTVKVQTNTVAHGKYAVQFHGAPNVVSYDFIVTKHAPAALLGHHYGRAYFYVTPKPPQEHTEFLFAGSSGFPKLKYLELAESGLNWQLTYVQLVAPTGENYQATTSAIPLVKWACLEWEMNDSPDQISVSVNGAKQATFGDIAFMSKSTGLVGGFSDFGFGFYIWHPATYAFDVYYDDIVLDTKPIGCLPP